LSNPSSLYGLPSSVRRERLLGFAYVSLSQVAVKLFEDRIVDVDGAEFLALADLGAHGQEDVGEVHVSDQHLTSFVEAKPGPEH